MMAQAGDPLPVGVLVVGIAGLFMIGSVDWLIAVYGLDFVMAGAALTAVSLGLLLYLWPGWGARSKP